MKQLGKTLFPIATVFLLVGCHHQGFAMHEQIKNNTSEKPNTPGPETANFTKYMAYLQQYGYLESSSNSSVEDVQLAIKLFQEYGNMTVTSELDATTIELMNKPRCGVPDMERDSDGGAVLGGRMHKRYAYTGDKWPTNEITFRILGSSGSQFISAEQSNEAIRRAFKIWSFVTPIKFIERFDYADINLEFSSYYHGDSYPFDGVGGNLAHAYPPSASLGDIDGDVHFDDSEPYADTEVLADQISLYRVAAHQIGHSLGLAHSEVSDSTMFAYYSADEPVFTLHYDDIQAIQNLYGHNPNNPPTTTTVVGARITTVHATTTTTVPEGNSNTGIIVAVTLMVVLLALALTVIIVIFRRREIQNGDQLPDQLTIIGDLGSGKFGRALLAEMHGMEMTGGRTRVAVKTTKEGAPAWEKESLLRELDLMRKLKVHPHVLRLVGFCIDQDPYYIIVEYMENGNLRDFLLNNRKVYGYAGTKDLNTMSYLSQAQLMQFGKQVADGMDFIASNQCIHRDLAARNILVGKDLTCKVSDFGLARDIMDIGKYERQSDTPLPIRWMAIESLVDGIHTIESDVWSFGILLWEIITIGAQPYPGMGKKDIINDLRHGYRMPRPKYCQEEVYDIMLQCWADIASTRPTFSQLSENLDHISEIQAGYLPLKAIDDDIKDDMTVPDEDDKV